MHRWKWGQEPYLLGWLQFGKIIIEHKYFGINLRNVVSQKRICSPLFFICSYIQSWLVNTVFQEHSKENLIPGSNKHTEVLLFLHIIIRWGGSSGEILNHKVKTLCVFGIASISNVTAVSLCSLCLYACSYPVLAAFSYKPFIS